MACNLYLIYLYIHSDQSSCKQYIFVYYFILPFCLLWRNFFIRKACYCFVKDFITCWVGRKYPKSFIKGYNSVISLVEAKPAKTFKTLTFPAKNSFNLFLCTTIIKKHRVKNTTRRDKYSKFYSKMRRYIYIYRYNKPKHRIRGYPYYVY